MRLDLPSAARNPISLIGTAIATAMAVLFQGCFRCHDENHKATDGTTIAQDCQSCHAMP